MPSSPAKRRNLPNAPVIETERLRLRGHREDDWGAASAMWGDPDVVRHIGGVTSPPQRTWTRLLGYAGHWSLMGFGYWAIEERATGTFAGEIGFADFKRELDPELAGLPEMGWALATAMHGRGYAREAAHAAIAWGDACGWPQTFCIIGAENAASRRLAAACGFREARRFDYQDIDTVLCLRERTRS